MKWQGILQIGPLFCPNKNYAKPFFGTKKIPHQKHDVPYAIWALTVMQTWVTRRDLGIVTFKTTGTKPIAEHGALYPGYPWPLLQLKNWRLTGISYFVMSFNIKKENMKFNWHFHKGQNAIVLNQTRINSTWHTDPNVLEQNNGKTQRLNMTNGCRKDYGE